MANAPSSTNLTLDQRRAKHALEQVQSVVTANKSWRSEYRNYVRSMPMSLRLNGFGQFIALEMAQASRDGDVGAGHSAALKCVLRWLTNNQKGWDTTPYHLEPIAKENVIQCGKRLIEVIVHSEQNESDMLRAQRELMAYLKWLKTFVEALIPAEEK